MVKNTEIKYAKTDNSKHICIAPWCHSHTLCFSLHKVHGLDYLNVQFLVISYCPVWEHALQKYCQWLMLYILYFLKISECKFVATFSFLPLIKFK